MKFSKIAGAVAVTILSTAGLASAEAEFTMRIAAGASSRGNVCNNYLDSWAEEVKEKSDGRIDYKMYCDGTLAKMGDAVNRVEQGIADVAWDVPAAYGARFAGLNVIGVPGLYNDPEPAAGAIWRAYESGALGQIDSVKLLWIQVVHNNSFFLRKPLPSYTNLNSAKIGMGSQIRARVVEGLNGVPIALKVPEYYQAMSKGSVDGLMTTAGAIFDFGIQEQMKEVFHAPLGGGLTFTIMSNKFYDSLPDDLKAVIDETTGYDRSKWAAAYLRDNENEQLASLAGVNVIEASETDIAALAPGLEAGRDAYLASDAANAGYLEAMTKALAEEQ